MAEQAASRPRKLTPAGAARILAERDPVIARLVAEAGRPSFPKPTDTHFATLVHSVTYQQLAGPAARAIHGRLVTALDGEITPERLLATPPEVLRAAGLSGNKVPSRARRAPPPLPQRRRLVLLASRSALRRSGSQRPHQRAIRRLAR